MALVQFLFDFRRQRPRNRGVFEQGNVIRQGVAGVYNRARYRAQKQTVLQAWSDLVEAAVGGEG